MKFRKHVYKKSIYIFVSQIQNSTFKFSTLFVSQLLVLYTLPIHFSSLIYGHKSTITLPIVCSAHVNIFSRPQLIKLNQEIS